MSVNYNPKIITNNLQIYYDWGNKKCYSGAGTTFSNLIAPSRNTGYLKNNVSYSTNNNGVIITNGSNGNGLQNAVGDRIDINTSAAGLDRFSGIHNFSIFVWYYSVLNSGKILSTGSAGTGILNEDQCIWCMYIAENIFFWWDTGGGATNVISCNFNSGMLSNTWQHIGFTYSYNDSGNNIVRTYINGIQMNVASISTATHSYIDRSNTAILQWTLGGGYSSSCYTSNSAGTFGLFTLYNKTLSAEEILQNYNATKSRFI